MRIYNLFPLLAGRLSEWQPHLQRAKQMDFDWIFVNPINAPGSSGSLYSIKDHFQIHSLLTKQQVNGNAVAQLRETIDDGAKLGLRFMADLVISHCAIDSPLITEHPEWFAWRDGKLVKPSCLDGDQEVIWHDLASFDHSHSADREGLFNFCCAMVDFLLGVGFTGFRCDAAYQVPSDLWRRLIQRTKKLHPQLVFCAESLGCSPLQTLTLAQAGFDYVFNSSKWWDFRSSWLMEQYTLIREATDSISFPESHDTPRLFAELNGHLPGIKQRYLFAALFSAGVMMPIGFEFGFSKRLHVVETRPTDWEQTEVDLTDFIKAVNRIKTSYPVFQEDAPTEMLPYDNPNILLLWKVLPATRQEALIILNKDINYHQDFYATKLLDFFQSKKSLTDISPEYRLDYLPEPFHYALRPGQAIVLHTTPHGKHNHI
jgi:starch synthase (maltosyl-transferring)